MKQFNVLGILLALLLGSIAIKAQDKFTIDLKAPGFTNTELIFSPFYIRVGFADLYEFNIDSNQYVKDFGKRFGFEKSSYTIMIQNKNQITGTINYPIPLTFQRFDPETNKPETSNIFFLDSGSHTITLPERLSVGHLSISSPSNIEYNNFKKLFEDLYVKAKNENNKADSLIDLTEKEKRIGKYIKEHPNSFVALWEIINDYSFHDFNKIYLDNLALFSSSIKHTKLFVLFERKVGFEALSEVGKKFPKIIFDDQHHLSKESFGKSKFTFIDYWATSCAPCIRQMPKIAALNKEFSSKGVCFITITDERDPKRVLLAKKIMNKNRVTWKRYFDLKRDFFKKLNVSAYPLYMLVKQDGTIIFKSYGKLEEMKSLMEKNIL